jgi:hypothetical protein
MCKAVSPTEIVSEKPAVTLLYSTLRLVLLLRRAGCTAGMPLVFDLLLYLHAVLPAV